MNLTQIESLVRTDVPGCPEPLIGDAIIQACRQFAEDSGLLRDNVSITTVASTQDYTLTLATTSWTNEIFGIYAVRNASRILTPLAEDPSLRLDRSGTPSYYTYQNNQLQLYPTPDEATAFTAEVMVRPTYTAGASVVDDRFGPYIDLLSHWAKYRLHTMAAQAWTDPQAAMFNKQRYDALSSDAKWYGWRANTRAAISVQQRPFA
jgi:hypothetical protein